jgi:hypothetical protein
MSHFYPNITFRDEGKGDAKGFWFEISAELGTVFS